MKMNENTGQTTAVVGGAAGAGSAGGSNVAGGSGIASIHKPVLLDECVSLVAPALADGGVVVDCTLGLAGHATAFLDAAPDARLIGIDRDGEALEMATRRMRGNGLSDRFTPVHAAFDEFESVLGSLGIDEVQAVFMDLGLSSLQIDETDRGFSYAHDAPLDMRMDASQPTTAATVLAHYDEFDLTRIFREYGEERFARQIAREICRVRDDEPIVTSAQLNALVDRVIPRSRRPAGNPAKRVFQALRIEVNGELDKLARTLPQIVNHLSAGGRLVVESYHSLEDRTVKNFMRLGLETNAPADLPIVPEDAKPFLRPITHGALMADEAEKARNPRSGSVRLRGVELVRPLPQGMRERFERMTQGEEDPFAQRDRRPRRDANGRNANNRTRRTRERNS